MKPCPSCNNPHTETVFEDRSQIYNSQSRIDGTCYRCPECKNVWFEEGVSETGPAMLEITEFKYRIAESNPFQRPWKTVIMNALVNGSPYCVMLPVDKTLLDDPNFRAKHRYGLFLDLFESNIRRHLVKEMEQRD